MNEHERTTFILSQGFVFWLCPLLPWSYLFTPTVATSITYGWLAAGLLWIGTALVRFELVHG